VDTIRSCRTLAVAHQLGHVLMGEQDARISLLRRLAQHATNTALYNVYYGKNRDTYDVRGRTAHEAVFNAVSGVFRCPNSQQGFSPFSTWTRGLAWAICGYAEQLEFVSTLSVPELESAACHEGIARAYANAASQPAALIHERIKGRLKDKMVNAALYFKATLNDASLATADFYLENSCTDGIPMWDTGAPNLHRLGNYVTKASDPYNKWEPVDSSAAAIAAQGMIRLGNYLNATGDKKSGTRYRQAGLTIAKTLFSEPYLSMDQKHQGLILHSVYHRPNGWDYIAPGQKVPNGESSMWGNYHARELALLILREARGEHYLTFFGCVG
jgi:hypothetical protein